ncbi:MAG: ABC transporter ATP-binding protein [Firmicutes bacterium]|nr:ABC transporter ATP-binding protein [Bacillota bacterium]
MSIQQLRATYAVKPKILTISDLVVKFRVRGRILTALREASLDVYQGECLCIVGESGSGKSVLVKSLTGLLDENGWTAGGSILYKQFNLARFRKERQWLQIRGKQIAMVFQDPMTALNPLKTVGHQIQEAVELHQGLRGNAARRAVLDILSSVQIPNPETRYHQYPFELSGGLRQRVVFAIAIASRPRILICDEPTTALDVTVQAQLLELLAQLQQQYKLTVIFITHDLGVVARIADRVAVMYAGEVIEVGLTEEVFYNPRHPYTINLLLALPQLKEQGKPLYAIKGAPPSLFEEIKGDAFAPRNPRPLRIDFVQRPPWFRVSSTHKAKTWLLDPRAPTLELPRPLRELAQNKGAGR